MADDFSIQVGKWVDEAGERAEQAFRGLALAALTRVKQLTPVDTGWLRSNWQVTVGDEALPVERERPPGLASMPAKRIEGFKGFKLGGVSPEQKVRAARLGDTIRIVNPVSYARPIEYGRQSQGPDGALVHSHGRAMVQQTVDELPRLAQEVIDRLKTGGGSGAGGEGGGPPA